MKINKKTSQLNIRISEKQKDKISMMASNAGYKSISKFLIDKAMDDINIKTKNDKKIYVVSLSTAIDYFIKINEIGENKGGSNKFLREDKLYAPGGRGINLSRMLNAYNVENLNIHFSSGFSGQALYRLLDEQGVDQYRIESDYDTKINVYAEDSNGRDISLEEKTSELSEYAKQELYTFIDKVIDANDIFVLSGSFAEKDIDYLKSIVGLLNDKGVELYINSSSRYIKQIIGNSTPELIVLCTRNSLGEVKSKKAIFEQMEEFLQLGCKNTAFVSDYNFSLFLNKESKYMISSEPADVLTYSGLEDAFMSGYIANIDKDIEERLKWAGASVRSKAEDNESIHFNHIVKYIDEIVIK